MFKVNELFFVSGQIDHELIMTLKEENFENIICNRPDNEEPNQPTKKSVEDICKKNFLNFYDLEFKPGDIDFDKILKTFEIISEKKKTLAYCRTGTRSITLWAFASCNNMDVDQILDAVAQAGYDLNHLRDVLVGYKASLS
tara:strand:- start:1099 stop:1521 length:423 start_codon:yes stop_codon:yes gene_type:complete